MEDYNEYIELQSNMYQYYNDINTSHINISNINNNKQEQVSSQYMNKANDQEHMNKANDESINDDITNEHNNNDISIDTNNDYDKNNDDIIDTSMLKPICENDLDFTNCVKSNEHNDINTSVYYYKDYK